MCFILTAQLLLGIATSPLLLVTCWWLPRLTAHTTPAGVVASGDAGGIVEEGVSLLIMST